MNFRTAATGFLALVATLSVTAPAMAQQAPSAAALPNKTFRIIVPFVAGTGLDVSTRLIAERLAARIGRNVIVENKPGAGHVPAFNDVKNAPPDGTTMVVSTTTMAVRSGIANPPYDIRKDLEHIILRGETTFVLYVNSSLPVRNVKELIDWGHANPGKLNFGTIGPGSSTHFAAIMFGQATGVKFEAIHFKGSAPAIMAAMAGDIHGGFDPIGLVRAQAAAGKLRMLAVTSLQRSREIPDVPTLDESGVKGYKTASWMGFSTTKGTPRGTILALNRAFLDIHKDPTVIETYTRNGAIITAGTPEEMVKAVDDEVVLWQRLIKSANITIE